MPLLSRRLARYHCAPPYMHTSSGPPRPPYRRVPHLNASASVTLVDFAGEVWCRVTLRRAQSEKEAYVELVGVTRDASAIGDPSRRRNKSRW